MTGWKLVPVEAAEKMTRAGAMEHAMSFQRFGTTAEGNAQNVWREMSQAAPTPPDEVLEKMGSKFLDLWPEEGIAEAMRAALAAAEERSEQAAIPTAEKTDA